MSKIDDELIVQSAFNIVLQAEGDNLDDLRFNLRAFSTYQREELERIPALYVLLKGILWLIKNEPDYLFDLGLDVKITDILEKVPPELKTLESGVKETEEEAPNGKTIH